MFVIGYLLLFRITVIAIANYCITFYNSRIMTQDAAYAFSWWLMIFAIGSTTLPITFRIFRRFFDKGYIFSKILGIVLSSYAVWLLGSVKILPFTKITILLVLMALFILNLWIMNRGRKNHTDGENRLPWKIFILEELLFLGGILFWVIVRSNEPSIHGLEKFMDYGFVQSILRGSYFPPLDMWLTKSPDYNGGYFINYYYYGHYVTAFLTKLSGINSAVTYNLMLCTLFAFTFTLSFSIGGNLVYFLLVNQSMKKGVTMSEKRAVGGAVIAGILAGFLVATGGNLHTIYSFTTNYPNESPVPFWQLEWGFHPEKYWYPNATRFIPFTIHEFPLYSFVVADLHGHVSDIPMVLLTLAILLSLVLSDNSISPEKETLKNLKKSGQKGTNKSIYTHFLNEFESNTSIPLPVILLLGLLLSVMYMTNAWDGMIYMILSVLVIFYRNMRLKRLQPQEITFWNAVYKTFSSMLFLVFFFLIFNLPFSMNFRPFVSGVGVLCAPKSLLGKTLGPLLFEEGKCQKSPLYMLAILWGFFYFNVFAYLILSFFPKVKTALKEAGSKIKQAKNKLTGKDLFRSRFVLKLTSARYNLRETDMYVLILVFISSLLLIFPEFFYLKDIYPAHYRANTMFKLGYQAFMMLGIASAYFVFTVNVDVRNKNRSPFYMLYKGFFLLLFTLVAIYPYFAINSYYNNLKTHQGLDGLKWLETQYPDDYKAIVWLNENIRCPGGDSECNNQPVIAEANGDSYTDYARVSANTGLPTIVGWPVHEWLWRGSYDEAGKRIPEVVAIYESKDMNETKNILKKYNVEYIFVGTLEREKYKNLNEEKLNQLGKVVFESGNTSIIKVNTI